MYFLHIEKDGYYQILVKYNFGLDCNNIKKQIFLIRSVFTRLDENRDIQCALEESFIFLTERSYHRLSLIFVFIDLISKKSWIFVLPQELCFSSVVVCPWSLFSWIFVFCCYFCFNIFQVWLLAEPEANVCWRRREDDAKDVDDGGYQNSDEEGHW